MTEPHDDGAHESDETIAELFIALTARWRDEAGRLGAGVPHERLLAALGVANRRLDELLARLTTLVAPLGLEVVDYYYQGQRWYSLKSEYAAPSELSAEEQGVLGVLMMLVEASGDEQTQIDAGDLRRRLVEGRYLSRYQLDLLLAGLEQKGYLIRTRQRVGYGPRTLLEFAADRRSNIADEAERLIF